MSSTNYTVSPRSLHERKDRPQDHYYTDITSASAHHQHPLTPSESNLLSPYLSQLQSSSASPDGTFTTPADSTTSFGFSSDFSGNEDPFFGADFDNSTEGAASFLNGANLDTSQLLIADQGPAPWATTDNASAPNPITFPQSALAHPTSARDQQGGPAHSVQVEDFAEHPITSTTSVDSSLSAPQLTPDTNGGGWSSDECLAQKTNMVVPPSPRVTVSVWGQDGEASIEDAEKYHYADAESPLTARPARSSAGDLSSYGMGTNTPRDARGSWVANPATGLGGIAPEDRPSEEIMSLNQQTARREVDHRNRDVSEWVSGIGVSSGTPENNPEDEDEDDNVPEREIALGGTTQNKYLDGQAYYQLDGPGGPITEDDARIMQEHRLWQDPPVIHSIQQPTQRTQPESSQAAIARFQLQADNQSMLSRAATWGTRRMSLPNDPSDRDTEGVLSGNFLKKLTINGNRRQSIRERVGSIVNRSNSISTQIRKRKGSNASDLPPEENLPGEDERRESRDSLAPPPRTSSWGLKNNKQQPPSINTALFNMTTGAAAIGTTHARGGSVSATPITSPKSPLTGFMNVPQVRNTLTKRERPRSKTELPRPSLTESRSHPNLVGLWGKTGGPPVATQLLKSQPMTAQEDDDDEDDDAFEDSGLRVETEMLDIVPSLDGFKQHILRLNPELNGPNDWTPHPHNYLIDRVAHHLLVRYKQLLNAKVRHLDSVGHGRCNSGLTYCIAQGGSSQFRGEHRPLDPLATGSDEDLPQEGTITAESFPPGIPKPPASRLPAEFECQLCFTTKKFQKPSDWTKHVHEDVQPFTCTWEHCKDPKMFKRKADWVRHENEGHRHLEGWRCDVNECNHACFRRDNFLQHLVREHKFTEPKIKTKAAIKKAGAAADETWQKVEQCHFETTDRPQDEPCRFCGKTFPTWKKLTVHLAKHMEHISLPVLKLVENKELDANTVISPVQDPPQRNFETTQIPPKPEFSHQSSSPQDYPQAEAPAPYTVPPFYPSITQQSMQNQMYPSPMVTQYPAPVMIHSHQDSYTIPITTAPSFNQPGYIGMPNTGLEPFPSYNTLGIHDPTGGMGYDTTSGAQLHPQHPQQQQQQQHQQHMDHYSSHGSVSPYEQSPNQGHTGYY